MFIKWAKEVFGEWWKEYEEGVSIASFFYVLAAWIFVIVLEIATSGSDKGTPVLLNVFVPFLVITGIVPTFLFIGWKIGNRIRNLYLDYSYYAANGGKRKREETK